MFSFFAACATFFFLAYGVVASPTSTKPHTLIVWNPKITSPTFNDKPWASGETRNVTWCTRCASCLAGRLLTLPQSNRRYPRGQEEQHERNNLGPLGFEQH